MAWSNRSKKAVFWVTFAAFLALAITPLIIMYDQIEAEVGYWFSSNSTNDNELDELGELSEEELAKLNPNGAPIDLSALAAIDRDGDGIPDYLETSLFGTDPMNPDTDGDGYSDWEEILNGYDPLSHSREKVDLDGDWLKDEWEINRYGTNPRLADTDGDGVNDGEEIAAGSSPTDAKITRINPDLEQYYFSIPKIQTKAPIVFLNSRDENSIYEGLKNGYVHYSRTAFPGENGDGVYFCHSSTRYGSSGDYDTICANLDKLERGDEIVISSETTKLRYAVTSRTNDYDPSDPKIFRKTQRPTMSIISCWPVGTNRYRIVVRAELISL
jgi:LPXTG-site transpeptidase (sortase) family protein